MTDLAVTDALFFERTGMSPARVEALVAEIAGRDGRRRAVPRIQPVGEPRARRRPHQERELRHVPGVRAARGCRRGRRLRPCLGALGGGDPPRGGDGAGGGQRLFRGHGRASCRAQTGASIPRTTRSAWSISRPRRGCSPRSTPMRAAATPGSGRSWLRSSGVWQAVQIIRPDGRRVADIRPLVRLNVAIVVGEDDRMETGSAAPAAASPMTAISIRSTGRRRSMRRCARRSSISARCRRRRER